MAGIDYTILLTNNPCYQQGKRITPTGIVVHSTGCNNPTLRRYIAPDNGFIGKNAYNNSWNRPDEDVCVHAFIGLDKNGTVKTVQTLPFNYRCWGVGSGICGSYNASHIQFEMCEDNLTDKAYCLEVYNKAVEFCAYLCGTYGIQIKNIVSHREAYLKGYGSDHIDPTNWWTKFGLTMDGFRADVAKALGGVTPTPTPAPTPATKPAVGQPTSCKLTFAYLGRDWSCNVSGQVRTVQRILNTCNYKGKDGKKLAEDGVFGVNTEYAVIAYQKKHKLDADGVVGPATWKALTGAK